VTVPLEVNGDSRLGLELSLRSRVSFVSLDHFVFQVMACGQAASAYDSPRRNYPVQLFQYTILTSQKACNNNCLLVKGDFVFNLRGAKLLKIPGSSFLSKSI
jgi:hypothetical protein